MKVTPIEHVQGTGLFSPLAGQEVLVRGVVTGSSRKGFFIQAPQRRGDGASCGLFVFERRRRPPLGSLVEVRGRVVDYVPDEHERPTTQLDEMETRVLEERGPPVEPVWLTAERVLVEPGLLAQRLNALEGMVVGVEAGSVFAAPSNAFGDYVVVPPGASLARTQQGGVLIDPARPQRWLPSLRVLDYDQAPRVHVGAELLQAVVGPLNFRSGAYQLAARDDLRVGPSSVDHGSTGLVADGSAVTVMTLNGFNLDPRVEDPRLVNDPARDVDDDVGDRRFEHLAGAIVRDARCPDIVALQEIQDSDGAELTQVVSAKETLTCLVNAIREAGGPGYRWADIPPEAGADGGQPGGNIRNAFLYRSSRVELLDGSLRRLGVHAAEYEGSRKPLSARFRVAGGELEVINVHLASKRHQFGLFAPAQPGFDPRLELRVRQVELLASRLHELRREGVDYYVTGDFNDFEFSETLQALCGNHSVNLLERVPSRLRFDYNHRGVSQALMHGVVAARQLDGRRADYEVLHANALFGVRPGALGMKPSDHAYVLARLELAGR
ncbi:MAG: endonuclease/exonuclease/phosphatase family protein [Planctomycetota bacterium]